MDEYRIIAALVRHYWRVDWPVMINNVYIFGENESDFIAVSKAGLIYEFEIKTTKSDFKKDAAKKRNRNFALGLDAERGPNKFLYVVPNGLIVDVPEYAGLVYALKANDFGLCLTTVKPGPYLHRVKFEDNPARKKIMQKVSWRHTELLYSKCRREEDNHELP